MIQQAPFRKPQSAGSPLAVSQAERVLEALSEQVDCYRRLAKLAEIQHQHIQQEQPEALLDVLRSRQEVLDAISKLEAIVGPVKKTWSDFANGLAPDRRAAGDALLAETRKLLEQITNSDRDDVLVLQQRKIALARQIGQATQQRHVGRTYTNGSAYAATSSRMDVQR